MSANLTRLEQPELRPEPWTEQASCRGVPDTVFYPPQGRRIDAAVHDAVTYCARCPVRDECLRYAIDRDEPHGIWGGLTPGQRQQIQHRIHRTHQEN